MGIREWFHAPTPPGPGRVENNLAFNGPSFGRIVQGLRGGTTALFCGAGISRNSGLPVVHELKSSILSRMGVAQSDRETIMTSTIPFEAFMQGLEAGGPLLGHLFFV